MFATSSRFGGRRLVAVVTGLLLVVSLGMVSAQDLVLSDEDAATFVERFDAIFDGPTLEIADEILAPNFISRLPLAPELDLEAFKAYIASFYEGFPDLTQEVYGYYLTEDRLILHVSYHATHTGPFFGIPPTGNNVIMNGIGIFEFDENGQAVNNWAVLDVGGVLAQIGAFPPSDTGAANDTVRQSFDRAGVSLETGDYADLEALVSDSYVVHSPLGDLDAEGVKAFFDSLRAALTDFKVDRIVTIVEGNMVAVRMSISGVYENPYVTPTGTFAPTGQPVYLELNNIFHLNEENRVVEEWVQFDALSFLTQMGIMPPAQPEPAAEVSDAEATIRKFYEYNNAEDYDSQNALWADDATLTLPDGTVFEGRDEVITFRPEHSVIVVSDLEVDGNTVRWTSNTGGNAFPLEAVVEDGLIQSMRFR